MNLEILRKIGLSNGEIKVYSALLDLGSCPVNKIHEKTGIERRNIYDILNKLIERGLITYITENKKRFFQTAHPNKILGYIEEKELNLNNTKKEVIKGIPSLIEKFNFKRPDIHAEIYRGPEGVKAVWEDMLNYKKNYWIGSGRFFPRKFPIWFSNWNKRRIKLKVRWINIFRHELKKELKRPMTYEHIRFLPKEFSGNPTMICIFGNKTVNFIMGKDLFAFVIESKEIAENYKLYHKYLWDNVAKKFYSV
jgi:sugar-specific transcriptional regulator TrmB